jgi:hypothetical protein
MSTHKIRIPIIVLTPKSKELFLRWALEGFKLRKLRPRKEVRPTRIA